MTKIKVVVAEERQLTVTEKEFKYEEYVKKYPNIPWNDFLYLDIKNTKEPIPSINPLIIKAIQTVAKKINCTVIPITYIENKDPYYRIRNNEHTMGAVMHGSEPLLYKTYSIYEDIPVYGMVLFYHHQVIDDEFVRVGLWNTIGKANTLLMLSLINHTNQTYDIVNLTGDQKKDNVILLNLHKRFSDILLNSKDNLYAKLTLKFKDKLKPPEKINIKYVNVKFWTDLLKSSVLAGSEFYLISQLKAHNVDTIYYTEVANKQITSLVQEYNKKQEFIIYQRQLNHKQVMELLRLNKLNILSKAKYKKPYHILSKDQQKIVDNIYFKEKQKKDAIEKYPVDIKLLWNLDNKIAKAALKDIRDFDGKSNFEFKIEDVVCEHVINIVENEPDIKMIIKQYAGPAPGTYYCCKLCGEELAPIEVEAIDMGELSNYGMETNGELDNILYSIITYTLFNYVNAKLGIDKNLIKDIKSEIYDNVHSIYIKLKRVKTMEEPEFNANMNLVISANVHASIIKLILDNPLYIDYKVKLATNHDSKQNKKNHLFTIALALLKRNYKAGITNLTLDGVKKLLIDAFDGLNVIKLKESVDDVSVYLSVCYFYNIIYLMTCTEKNKQIEYYDYKTVLDIKEDTKSVFENCFTFGTFDEYINDPLYISKLPKNTDELRKLGYDTLIYSIGKFANQIVNRPSDEIQLFSKMCQEVIQFENEVVNYNLKLSRLVPKHIYFKKFKPFRLPAPDLSIKYDEKGEPNYDAKGNPIKYTTVIISHNGSKKEVPIKDFYTLIGTPIYNKYTIIGYKDTKGELLGKGNPRAVEQSIQSKFEIQSFYNYYSIVCPIAKIHEWTSVGNKCKICNITSDLIINCDLDYYKKYKSNFSQSILPVSGKNKEPTKVPELKYLTSRLDTSNINRISKVFNLPYNYLLNIGNTEGYEFDQIYNKLINPSEEVSYSRVNKLLIYHNLISSYISILYNMKGNKLPYDLASIKNTKVELLDPIDRTSIFAMQSQDASNLLLNELFSRLVKLLDINKELTSLLIDKMINYDMVYAKFSYKLLREREVVNDADTIEVDDDDGTDDEDGVSGDISFEGFDFDEIDNLEGGQDM
jgi:hypothetical protein